MFAADTGGLWNLRILCAVKIQTGARSNESVDCADDPEARLKKVRKKIGRTQYV